MNKAIYEITHLESKVSSFSIVSSKKDAGKTEISLKLFEKLKKKNKVCLIDLDYRKKVSQKLFSMKKLLRILMNLIN